MNIAGSQNLPDPGNSRRMDNLTVGSHGPKSCILHSSLSSDYRAQCSAAMRHNRAMSTTDDPKTLKEQGDRLREARRKAGFRFARDAAKAIGVSEGTYNPWENGHRSFRTRADDLARQFGVSRTWLLYGGADNYADEIFAALKDVPSAQREIATAAALGAIEAVAKRAGR